MRKFETRILVAAVGIILATWSSVVRAADVKRHPFGQMIGLNVKYSQGEPMGDLPLLKDLRVRWVRDTVGWPEVEPAAGQYAPFPEKFKQRLEFYKANDIGVVFILAYENKKAYPDSADHPHNCVNPQAFGRFAVEAAKQLKSSGVKFVLEIWNEPHNFFLAKAFGGEWNAKPPSPWVDQYLKMVRESVAQVKAYDPAVRLLDDDDMWIIHYRFLEKGLPKELDGFAFHPYSGASSGPEMTPVGQETGWAKPFTLVDADRSFVSAVRRLREQSVKQWGKVPPLWATEWGWAVGDKAPFTVLTPDGKVTQDTVAAYLPRAFITAAEAGVETLCWFSSYDDGDGPMGLRKNGGEHRPAFGAFKTMADELAAYTLDRHLVGADHPTCGVQVYSFASESDRKLVLWDIDGTADYQIRRNGIEPVRIVDVQGQAIPSRYTPDGWLQIRLTQSPVYVSGLPAELSMRPAAPPIPTAPAYLFP
ncbi:MAG TPA: hypothetical protein VLJ39_10475 [Tepidisphaeraceae bacterium]|nr:hypothetical protein [Tepidisphaeraceae bacterium]